MVNNKKITFLVASLTSGTIFTHPNLEKIDQTNKPLLIDAVPRPTDNLMSLQALQEARAWQQSLMNTSVQGEYNTYVHY